MRKLTFGSLFTGVGGFDLGFERSGMICKWQCEIDKHCVKVLDEHWKGMKRYKDVRDITKENTEKVDVICGGFPCQDLSVAGKRAGLDGERSGLWYEYARIIGELKPAWVVIENVPGLLSSNGGADFAVVLQALVQFGYGVSWRILDAQYFGVPQRRRRVFIVGSLGNGRSTEVLFESESLSGNIETGREKRKEITSPITNRIGGMGKGWARWDEDKHLVIDPLTARDYKGIRSDALSHIICAFQRSQLRTQGKLDMLEAAPNLKSETKSGDTELNIWQMNHASEVYRDCGNVSPSLQERMGTGDNNVPLVGVRRLIPIECERLQGFPGNWTASQSDTQRYKQMGNAVAVPVIEWIGKRIIKVIGGEYESGK